MTEPLLTLSLIMTLISLLWLVSLFLRDASIVDIFWAPGFLFVTLGAGIRHIGPAGPRVILVTALVALWAVRLGSYLFGRWRNKGHEDYRYQEMRKSAPNTFWLVSLFRVFWMQGALIWIISWPLQATVGTTPSPLGVLDYVGAAMAFIGIVLEGTADFQLSHFLADPSKKGKVMDRGIWSWSRHPNYFGNALMWWGYYVIALTAGAWWTIFAPIVMTFFLLRVSGVSLLESTIKDRRPGYAEYVKRTSAFIPLPPKRA